MSALLSSRDAALLWLEYQKKYYKMQPQLTAVDPLDNVLFESKATVKVRPPPPMDTIDTPMPPPSMNRTDAVPTEQRASMEHINKALEDALQKICKSVESGYKKLDKRMDDAKDDVDSRFDTIRSELEELAQNYAMLGEAFGVLRDAYREASDTQKEHEQRIKALEEESDK